MRWKHIVELIAVVLAALAVFHLATRTNVFSLKPGKGDAPVGTPQAPAAEPPVAVNYINYNQTNGANDIVVPGGASGAVDVLSSQSALEETVSDQTYGAWANYVTAVG